MHPTPAHSAAPCIRLQGCARLACPVSTTYIDISRINICPELVNKHLNFSNCSVSVSAHKGDDNKQNSIPFQALGELKSHVDQSIKRVQQLFNNAEPACLAASLSHGTCNMCIIINMQHVHVSVAAYRGHRALPRQIAPAHHTRPMSAHTHHNIYSGAHIAPRHQSAPRHTRNKLHEPRVPELRHGWPRSG
jgi:hypothetical protein